MNKYKLRETIVDLLVRIDHHGGYSHIVVDRELKSSKIDARDVALLTEIVYGTIQRKLTLDYYLEPFVNRKRKLKPWVRMLLRMSVYQMVFLDKVPDYAIIHEAVEIAKSKGHKGIGSFVNGVLRNIQRQGVQDTNKIKDKLKRLSIETSHPLWLVKRWTDQYGFELTKEICETNITEKPISIRTQPLKISREKAMKKMQEDGFQVEKSIFSKQGIIVKGGNILKSNMFSEGLITIQDQSSMLASEMLNVKPSMTVLDTCSAPGGKVTHIAEKMEDRGVVHAYDLHKKKVHLVNEKANELNLSIIQVNQGDARSLQDFHDEETFDRVIVDAPCSGLGVIRTKPDIKYTKQVEDIERLASIQTNILSHVAPLLKKDGKLVYSTCTIDKEENEQVVEQFLSHFSNFKIDQTFFDDLPNAVKQSVGISDFGLQLYPHTFQTDGFFLTRFIKI